jgi:hypothetical protein
MKVFSDRVMTRPAMFRPVEAIKHQADRPTALGGVSSVVFYRADNRGVVYHSAIATLARLVGFW